MQTMEEKKDTPAGKVKKFIQDWKKMSIKKKTQLIAIVLIIAVILTIYFSSITDKAKNKEEPGVTLKPQAQAVSPEEDTEAKLQKTLSNIDGAGRVEVMVTYKSGPELVPAYSTDTNTNKTVDTDTDSTRTSETENSDTEIVTEEKGGDANALILKQIAPEVKGVIVIAEGAGDIRVKLNLLRAVQTILAVSPEQIEVFEMKKG